MVVCLSSCVWMTLAIESCARFKQRAALLIHTDSHALGTGLIAPPGPRTYFACLQREFPKRKMGEQLIPTPVQPGAELSTEESGSST